MTKIKVIIFVCFLSLTYLQADSIVVGSKQFPESQLLGEIVSILIENNTELDVKRKFWMGGTLICFEAIKSGSIDIYVEYTGTGWSVILKKDQKTPNKDRVYEIVKDEFHSKYDIHWLSPFGFNNSYVIVVDKDYPVASISDLQKVQNKIRLGFSHEFMNRKDGLTSMKEFYNLEFANTRALEHNLAYRAIQQGQIDGTDAYGTDGTLFAYNLKRLEDDKNFFPPYYAAPIIYGPTLRKYPELESVLYKLKDILDNDTMTKLNYRVEINKESFYSVAFDFLQQKKLVSEKTEAETETEIETEIEIEIETEIERSYNKIIKLTKQHIFLVLVSIFIAIFIGVPLGIFISKKESFAPLVLGGTGTLQTIPSLAILAIMVPFFGIGFIPSVIALTLYALLPIVRNTYTGIMSVDPELKEAAMAMGMTHTQILLMLEIPMATKIIMAGIRTATVISVGTATLAAFIGGGGLGELILTGITLNDRNLILMGTIPAALLALAVDFILACLENFIEPKGLKINR